MVVVVVRTWFYYGNYVGRERSLTTAELFPVERNAIQSTAVIGLARAVIYTLLHGDYRFLLSQTSPNVDLASIVGTMRELWLAFGATKQPIISAKHHVSLHRSATGCELTPFALAVLFRRNIDPSALFTIRREKRQISLGQSMSSHGCRSTQPVISWIYAVGNGSYSSSSDWKPIADLPTREEVWWEGERSYRASYNSWVVK